MIPEALVQGISTRSVNDLVKVMHESHFDLVISHVTANAIFSNYPSDLGVDEIS